MQKCNARYKVEGSVHTRRGEHGGLVPRPYQNHCYQTKSQELVHNAEPVEKWVNNLDQIYGVAFLNLQM